MSMTHADGLDCEKALALLQDYLKREASPDLVPLIERHLQQCVPCLAHSRFERNFLAMLGARASEVRCPEALRARIVETLERDRGDA